MGFVDAVKGAAQKVVNAPQQAYEKVEEVHDHVQMERSRRDLEAQKNRYVKANAVEATGTTKTDADLASGKISQRLHDKRIERVEHKADEMRKPVGQRITENVKRNASYVAGGLESTSKHMQMDRGGKEDEHGNIKGGEGIHPFSRSQPKQPTTKGHTHVAAQRVDRRPIQNSRFGSGLAFNTGSGMGFKTGIDFSASHIRKPERRSQSSDRGNPYDLRMDFGGLFRKPKR